MRKREKEKIEIKRAWKSDWDRKLRRHEFVTSSITFVLTLVLGRFWRRETVGKVRKRGSEEERKENSEWKTERKWERKRANELQRTMLYNKKMSELLENSWFEKKWHAHSLNANSCKSPATLTSWVGIYNFFNSDFTLFMRFSLENGASFLVLASRQNLIISKELNKIIL